MGDRREKGFEYAILSPAGSRQQLYAAGIADVRGVYAKMYVIRPHFPASYDYPFLRTCHEIPLRRNWLRCGRILTLPIF